VIEENGPVCDAAQQVKEQVSSFRKDGGHLHGRARPEQLSLLIQTKLKGLRGLPVADSGELLER
jgi:hypothetical protein